MSIFREPSYDNYDRPHHPRCAEQPEDEPCICPELAQEYYDAEMDRRIDEERREDGGEA